MTKTVAVPGHVEVGPHRYTVITDSAEAQRERVTYGMTDEIWTRIILNPDQSASQLRDTLTHECLHAIMANYGLTGYDDAPLDATTSERVARALAPTLLELLRRNPDLVAYLTAP